MLGDLVPENINNLEDARKALVLILNIVEEQQQEIIKLRAEVQELRDENNRLKGEQGKPDIKANKKLTNISSEKERRIGQKKAKKKKRRTHKNIVVDREETLTVPKTLLPADAVHKGYEIVTVQDIELKTNNIRFKKEKWYSPSKKRTYLAEMPNGYSGQFGPYVRTLVITLYYAGGMSEPKIIEFIEQIGINLSKGIVSDWLSKSTDSWQEEADEIVKAGLASTSYQHLDDTGTRVDGVNHHCHILGNPLYTMYGTRRYKNRLAVISVLQNTDILTYLFNDKTVHWLEQFNLPQWVYPQITAWPRDKLLGEEEMDALVEETFAERLNNQQLARIREAGALMAYYDQDAYPVIPILVTDDAPQFQKITKEQAGCWVHEARHYKKLAPNVAYHQQILENVLDQIWAYYRRLQQYRLTPSKKEAKKLRKAFKKIFSQKTNYAQLNKRLSKTLANQQRLLVVLKHPEVPLHNNLAELGARQRVRKRDVSFGPRTDAGRIAWDTFMTIAETAKKLDVSFYAYVQDRISGVREMSSLADVIRSRSQAVIV